MIGTIPDVTTTAIIADQLNEIEVPVGWYASPCHDAELPAESWDYLASGMTVGAWVEWEAQCMEPQDDGLPF
jgi:hypothetical protein